MMESRLPKELEWKPGERPLEWLERNSSFFLDQLAGLALDPDVSAKVRLDAVKELICRPLPQKNVYELSQVESEIDRMSDEEVYEMLQEKMKELGEGVKSSKGK
jgi:hypothetical protein